MKSLRTIQWLVGFAAACCFAAQPVQTLASDPPPAKDPMWERYELDRHFIPHDRPLYWIDNDRLLLSAWEKGNPYSPEKDGSNIYIWDLNNGVSKFAKYEGRYCFANSRMFFVTVGRGNFNFWRDLWDFISGRQDQLGRFLSGLPFWSANSFYGPRWTYREGSLYAQTEGIRRFKTRSTLRFNDFSCRIQPRPFYLPDTPLWQPLRDGDGELVFSDHPSRKGTQNVDRYVDGEVVQNFQLTTNKPKTHWTRYLVKYQRWSNDYFIWEPSAYMHFHPDSVEIEGCIKAWRLRTAGNGLHEICLPRGPWNTRRAQVFFLPLRSGIGVGLVELPAKKPSRAGLYLSSGELSHLVVPGYIGQPGLDVSANPLDGIQDLPHFPGSNVSPNGCRVAVLASNSRKDYKRHPETRRVLVIDTCSGK